MAQEAGIMWPSQEAAGSSGEPRQGPAILEWLMGLKSKAAGTLYLLSGSWVPAQLCCWLAGQSGHPPSPLSLSFFSLLSPRKYTGCFELAWTGDRSVGEEYEN